MINLKLPERKRKIDFDHFVKVIKGLEKTKYIIQAELLIEEGFIRFIIENIFEEKYYPPYDYIIKENDKKIIDYNEKKNIYERYYRQVINIYKHIGYSLYADFTFCNNFISLIKMYLGNENKQYSQKQNGFILSWIDFEKFPWGKAYQLIDEFESNLEILSKLLPDGMKISGIGLLFEYVFEFILGKDNFISAMYEKADLFDAIFNKVGELVYDFYKSIVTFEVVGCIWHADDLGDKNDTILSARDLNKWVFPWYKKFTTIAHEKSKPFFLHSCGYKKEIMAILIDNVGIDAIHSFEDGSCSVLDMKKSWGDKVGIIGGVDVDKLVKFDEIHLREYINNILDICMENGRYIYGSGSRVRNEVPVNNFIIMLDEAKKWEEKVK